MPRGDLWRGLRRRRTSGEAKFWCALASPLLSEIASRLEQLAPAVHLRVRGVLDLEPARAAAVALVDATSPLPDDAFQLVPARRFVQGDAAPDDVVADRVRGTRPAA